MNCKDRKKNISAHCFHLDVFEHYFYVFLTFQFENNFTTFARFKKKLRILT